MHAATARWVPPALRSTFVSQTYFGSVFGMVFTFPLCGLVIEKLGWAACWYIIGSLTAVWVVAWFSLVHDSPATHPRCRTPTNREVFTFTFYTGYPRKSWQSWKVW